jgi:hypothetical protein
MHPKYFWYEYTCLIKDEKTGQFQTVHSVVLTLITAQKPCFGKCSTLKSVCLRVKTTHLSMKTTLLSVITTLRLSYRVLEMTLVNHTQQYQKDTHSVIFNTR